MALELESGGTGAQVRWHWSSSPVALELESGGTRARVRWQWSSSPVALKLESGGTGALVRWCFIPRLSQQPGNEAKYQITMYT